MVKNDLECDFCFKKVNNPKDLRKVRNMKSWKCKECQEKERRPKMTWYMLNELLQCTFENGGKLIGFKAPNGEFMVINKVLDDFTKPFRKCLDFVAHIQAHLNNDPKLKGQNVTCSFCKKSIDEIWDEEQNRKLENKKEEKKAWQ